MQGLSNPSDTIDTTQAAPVTSLACHTASHLRQHITRVISESSCHDAGFDTLSEGVPGCPHLVRPSLPLLLYRTPSGTS